MAEPIKGQDVIIQFMSGDNYVTYGCATDVSIEFSMETKSVKTIGDGTWRRKRGQNKGYIVSLSGVLRKMEDTPDAFDLLDYFKNMVDVLFRIRYTDETGVIQIQGGYALPTNVNMSSGAEGFATGAITLEGSGDPDNPYSPDDPDPDDQDPICEAEIETAHTEIIGPPNRRYLFIDSLVSGSPTITRYDYTIDGGGTQSEFTDGTLPASWVLPLATNVGDHTVVITPICENGFSGTPFTLDIP